jgi:hypothetical protein
MSKDITRYIGFIFLALIGLLIFNMAYKNYEKYHEGFTGDVSSQIIEKNTADIKNATEQLKDKFLLNKYRSDWENLIIAVEDKISATVLASLPELSETLNRNNEEEGLEKVLKKVQGLNELNKFRGTLNDSMKYLDGLK